MAGPFFQSTVGRIVFQSMQRRHALWAAMNAAVALVLYITIKIVSRLHSYVLRVPHSPFCIFEFMYHMVIFGVLSAVVYAVFSSDRAKFGGTSILHSQCRKAATLACTSAFVALCFGKSMLASLGVYVLSVKSLLDVSYQGHLLPVLSCFVALVLYMSDTATHNALQPKPQPVLRSFGAAMMSSVVQSVPRSVSVSITLSVVLMALRAAEATYFRLKCPSWAVSRTWEISTVFLCEGFNIETGVLPVYLPNTSVWYDVTLSFVAVAVLLFQVELLMSTLALITTYPLNFQKLKAQLIAGEATTSTDRNEVLMVQALLIGSESALVTTKRDSTGGANASISSANYAQQTAQAEGAVHAARHAALLQSVAHKNCEPSVVAYFGEASACANSSAFNRDLTPVKKTGSFDLLARSLAFQDLHRVAVNKPWRRAVLYEKHWPQVLSATLTMIDAAALQLYLLDGFMTKSLNAAPSTKPSSTFPSAPSASTPSAPAVTPAGSAPGQLRSGPSFEDMVKLRQRLAQNSSLQSGVKGTSTTSAEIEVQPSSHSSNDSKGRPASSLMASVLHTINSTNRDNKVAGQLLESAVLGLCTSWRVPVPGYGADYAGNLPVIAFPPICASTVTHAVESVAILLVHALAEDSSGFTQRSVCPVVLSLLGLETSLIAYCGTLQASQCVSISSMGRTQQIRYRARSENAVPPGIRALLVAVRTGLTQVLRAYRDVLVRVVANYDHAAQERVFSREQVIALEGKLLELNENK